MNTKDYIKFLHKIEGSTIAVVYVFEKDITKGFQHYDPWKSDVISDWLIAIQEIHCMPFIIDVRTFAQKALNDTLPSIDYVVNLNAGTNNLSTLALVPSICSFLNIPCIPADAVTTIIGENKRISNMLASFLRTNVPENLPSSDINGIFRPINYGSSRGVQKGFPEAPICKEYLYQRFITGFDMTIPILFNPLTEALESMPPVMYRPDNFTIKWFLGETEKKQHKGYIKQIANITQDAKRHFLNLAREFGISTFCRIDTRVHSDSAQEIQTALHKEIELQRINFIEINPLPTIKSDINFHTSFNAISEDSSLGTCIALYNDFFQNGSFVGFVLSSAIIALSRAMH